MTPHWAWPKKLRSPHRGSNDFALAGSDFNLGTVLVRRDDPAERDRGMKLLTHARDVSLPERAPSVAPVAALWIARETAKRGERQAALPMMRKALEVLHQEGRLGWEVMGTGLLVATLLEDGAAEELAEAEALIDRLANLSFDDDSAMVEIMLLQARAMAAHAHGDDVTYRELAGRYRTMAESLGYEGHVDSAQVMVAGRT